MMMMNFMKFQIYLFNYIIDDRFVHVIGQWFFSFVPPHWIQRVFPVLRWMNICGRLNTNVICLPYLSLSSSVPKYPFAFTKLCKRKRDGIVKKINAIIIIIIYMPRILDELFCPFIEWISQFSSHIFSFFSNSRVVGENCFLKVFHHHCLLT